MLVPQKVLLQPPSFDLEVQLYWNQGAKAIILVKIFLDFIVGVLQEVQFGDVHRVHARLVRHEIFQIILNRLSYFHHVSLYLSLQPKGQRRVVDSYN